MPATPSRSIAPTLVFVALVVAAIGSLGAPLITSVATTYDVSLAAAQWTLTITLLAGAVATPVLGRLGSGAHRRATVLATLALVSLGGLLTTVPLPFAVLLIGRALQGMGLGLTALMMAEARDHLGADRARSTIALISVASTIGIGIGYPVAGLLTDLGGIRAAYGLGLAVTTAALVVATVRLPRDDTGPGASVDFVGAVLLGAALLALLIPLGQLRLWSDHPAVAYGLVTVAALLFAVWLRVERRTATPLVDLTMFGHPAVAVANAAMLIAGAGMYLLLALITRYVQTPLSAGYGFGLNTLGAGLVLVPFSALGFVGGRLAARVQRVRSARFALGASTVIVTLACTVFAVSRNHLVGPIGAITILGLGVGGFSAAMPGTILAVVDRDETASAMSVNQVVRSVGFSLGSALAGLVLSASTPTDARFPDEDGYRTAALLGIAIMVAAFALVAVRRRRSSRGRVWPASTAANSDDS
jgi:predicted MFS family arabinose efflux permease